MTTGEIEDLDFYLAPRARLELGGCRDHVQQQDPGDISGEAIPVPIPNTEVKLSSAEDTERAAFREHRSSPGFCASWSGNPAHVVDDPAETPFRSEGLRGILPVA
jgi:hypothetical protein